MANKYKYQKEYTNARKRILYRKRRAEKKGLEFNIPVPKTYNQLKKEGYTRKQFIKETKKIISQSKRIDKEYKELKQQAEEVLDLSSVDILVSLLNEIPDYIQGYSGRGRQWTLETGTIRDNLLNYVYDSVMEAEENGTLKDLVSYYESVNDQVQEKITELNTKPTSDQTQKEVTLIHIATLVKGSPLTHAENEWFTTESEMI